MVTADHAPHLSVEDWRALLRRSGVKYEYSGGRVSAMAGGTADHSRVAVNLTHDLDDALGDSPCRVYNSDLAVRLSPTEYRFPDASVTCDEHDHGDVTEVASPRVLVEVLSDSTEREDRTVKARLYRACPTVEEYAFIATRYRAMEVYRRAGAFWTAEVYLPGDTAVLTSIDVRLPVNGLYRRTTVPEGRPGETAAADNN
ncbi:MAG: Uma2 family endonuclease [Chloroflexota bacterium]